MKSGLSYKQDLGPETPYMGFQGLGRETPQIGFQDLSRCMELHGLGPETPYMGFQDQGPETPQDLRFTTCEGPSTIFYRPEVH